MAEIVTSIAEKVVELSVAPILKHICYPFKYESNMKELTEKDQELTDQKERVQNSVGEATRQCEQIYEDVENWMKRVDELTEKVVKPLIDEQDRAGKLCSLGFFSNLMTRYSLSKKAEKTAKEGVKLLEAGKFEKISYLPPIQRTISTLVRGYKDFNSRTPIFEKIMKALVEEGVNLIGVYGMGGVGKTTLVKRVAAQAIEEKLFDVVVMVEVKQIPDVKSLQKQIADELDLKFDKKSLPGRAAQLHKRLKQETSVLLILDNIWKRLDLDAVGIPFWNDEKPSDTRVAQRGRTANQRKCKLLLTSRDLDVLRNDMNTQKNFMVDILSDVEATDLFLKIVNHSKEEPDFNHIAVEIVKKCAGLPIAIKTVANALKNKVLSDWKSALEGLRRSKPKHIKGMEDGVYSTIKLSYEVLGPEEQSLFLLCSLNSTRSIWIDDLFNYGMGLGLFKDVDTMEDARNMMHTLISNLKASCLLLDGNSTGWVKMHDIIYDVANSIASSNDKLMFNIHNVTGMKKRLEEELPKDSTAVSIIEQFIDGLPERLEFPKLEFLCLARNHPPLQIPDVFFDGVNELKVLDLAGFDLSSLPSSLCLLTNLQTLFLYDCSIGDISVVRRLKKLEILSFSYSRFEQLPGEIKQLTHLRLLDLSNCSKLKVIPPNVLSSLTRLEELYIGNSFVQWDVEGQSNASLVELKKLSNLTTLEIHVCEAQIIPDDLVFGKLERYRIFIGDVWKWSDNYETSRTLKLKLNNRFSLSNGIKSLLKRVEDLHLHEPKSVENVLQQLNGEGFQQLKHLHIQNASRVQYIVNSDGWGPCNVFFNRLESLVLQNLINLEKIYHGQLTTESFSQLKVIKVGKCDNLKHLTLPMAGNLLQLKKIEVTHCNNLEEIVFMKSRQVQKNEQTTKIEFAQMQTMTLQGLPRLMRFGLSMLTPDMGFQEILCEDNPDNFIAFFSQNVLLPRLENLKLSSFNIESRCLNQLTAEPSYCRTLVKLTVEKFNDWKFLFPYCMVKSFVQLRELTIQNCESMEAIFNMEEFAREEASIEKIFPKLSSLELKGLPELRRFGSGNSVEFPSLSEFIILDCPQLNTFLSGSTCETIIVNPEQEETNSCNGIHHLLDKQVSLPSLYALGLRSISSEVIWSNQSLATSSYLHNLTYLVICSLCNLKFVFSSSMVESLDQLKVLQIIDCKVMEVVVVTEEEGPSPVLFRNLHKLKLQYLPKLTRFCDFIGISVDLSSLSHLWIKDCPNMETFISNSVCANMTKSAECSGMHSEEKLQANIQPFFDEKVRLSSLKKLRVEQMDNIRKIWHDQLDSDSFCKLELFHVHGCNKLFSVFPSNMLGRLQRLDKLLVKKCDIVEEIFELEAFGSKKTHGIVAAQLKALQLHNLPRLKHVWNMDSQVILSSQNLHSLSVHFCEYLKSLFPASVARGLDQLEELHIVSCKMEEIITKEDDAEAVPAFVFPQLKELELRNLSRLKRFHSGLYISKWPMLETLTVWSCHGVEMLASEFQSHEESPHDIPSGQPLFLIDKIAFPCLKRLRMDWNCVVKDMSREMFSEYSCMLNYLELSGPFAKAGTCPSCFLCKLPNSISLTVCNGFLKDLFLCEGLVCKEKHFESSDKLSFLEFCQLSDSLLWKEYSESNKAFQNLTTLKVDKCGNLQSLVPSTMSFRNLTTLEVSNCDELLNLLAPSTAKSLVQLTRMDVIKCKKIKEIITHKGEEVEDRIVFNQLKYLGLDHLPSLSIFYSGTCTIEFPSLQKVVVNQCPNAKIFSRGELRTPKLHTLQIGEIESCWEGDLNTSIAEHLNTSIAQQNIEKCPQEEEDEMEYIDDKESIDYEEEGGGGEEEEEAEEEEGGGGEEEEEAEEEEEEG